jgi:hypothetical protein
VSRIQPFVLSVSTHEHVRPRALRLCRSATLRANGLNIDLRAGLFRWNDDAYPHHGERAISAWHSADLRRSGVIERTASSPCTRRQ